MTGPELGPDAEFHVKLRAEYDYLSRLEQSTTQLRYSTFTALVGISFLIPGIAASQGGGVEESVDVLGQRLSLTGLGFLIGFVFYLFSVVHYAWYHRHAHAYRKRLKEIESTLGIEVYKLRTRPRLGRMKFHFDWTLYIMGAVYAVITASFVGAIPLVVMVAACVLAYALLLVWSIGWSTEPLE